MTDEQYKKASEIKGKLYKLEKDLKKYQENESKIDKTNMKHLAEICGQWNTVNLRSLSLEFSVSDFEMLNKGRLEMVKIEILKLETEFKNIKST